MDKSPDAFRTISEVADWLKTPAHVLRFWESRFSQVKPVKRAGGRRYYRPADMALLGGIKKLLHEDGMTIRGAQKLLRENGVRYVSAMSPVIDGVAPIEAPVIEKSLNVTALSDSPYLVPESERTNELDDIPAREVVPPAPMAENVPTGAFDTPAPSVPTPSVVAFAKPAVPEIPTLEISSSALDETDETLGDMPVQEERDAATEAQDDLDLPVSDEAVSVAATETSSDLASTQPALDFKDEPAAPTAVTSDFAPTLETVSLAGGTVPSPELNQNAPEEEATLPELDTALDKATHAAALPVDAAQELHMDPLQDGQPEHTESDLAPEQIQTSDLSVETEQNAAFVPSLDLTDISYSGTSESSAEPVLTEAPSETSPVFEFAATAPLAIDISHIPLDCEDDSPQVEVLSGVLGRLSALNAVDPHALQPIVQRAVTLHAKLSGA